MEMMVSGEEAYNRSREFWSDQPTDSGPPHYLNIVGHRGKRGRKLTIEKGVNSERTNKIALNDGGWQR